jgi:hypothetical protein
MRKKTNLVIFKAGKKVRSKITLVAASTICPHGVPPGMFSIVIVEISTESVKACSILASFTDNMKTDIEHSEIHV